MDRNELIVITDESEAFFHNNVDYCVGTGRMGLALTKEYYEQLKLVQEEIGFKHIRGHGLFCDDMAIYQEYEEDGVKKAEYNFTYLDRVMDSYRSVGLSPFLELGFMPDKMARGTQKLFYWKANTTPPKDYGAWRDMVQALLKHLMERYGADEVVNWPIEVWNEPNLCGFWENADMPEYFKLFKSTFEAVKETDARFKVGGPAVCGGYCLFTKTVDEKTCNPLKVWHDLGEPASLSKEQRKLLAEAARPFIRTKRKEAKDGRLSVKLELERNAVVYFEVIPSEVTPDRGYDYERVTV